jgi:hypothetical protein
MFLDQCGIALCGMANAAPETAKPRIGFLQHGVSRRVTYAPSVLTTVVIFLSLCRRATQSLLGRIQPTQPNGDTKLTRDDSGSSCKLTKGLRK